MLFSRYTPASLLTTGRYFCQRVGIGVGVAVTVGVSVAQVYGENAVVDRAVGVVAGDAKLDDLVEPVAELGRE